MQVTDRELDAFIDEVELLGYSVRYSGITGFGQGEVVIDRNGAGDPYEFGYDIRQITYDLAFRDYDMTTETEEVIVITLF